MRPRIVILFFLVFTRTLFSQEVDPVVAGIISSTNIDSLTTTVSELSGMVPAIIDGLPYTIASRHNGTTGNVKTASYLFQKLKNYGLTPQFHDFSSGGQNVYAVQYGVEQPGKILIVCAHYDDQPAGALAPGADDNASGTAAVMEAARVLSKFQTGYSIIYALWDKEEQGLIGSTAYANEAFARGDSILGVINLDMIAWDSNNDMSMEIHTSSVANSLLLSDTVTYVNNTYAIGLSPGVRNPGTTSSDHASFWSRDYGALLLIESFTDFNLFYHSTNDLLSVCNVTFFHRMSQLSLGTIAVLAGVQQVTGVSSSEEPVSYYSLHQNYPNPFNPTTTISYVLPFDAFVTLEVFDMLGRRITTLVGGQQPAGRHDVMWNATGQAGGIYLYRLKTGEFIQTKLMALLK